MARHRSLILISFVFLFSCRFIDKPLESIEVECLHSEIRKVKFFFVENEMNVLDSICSHSILDTISNMRYDFCSYSLKRKTIKIGISCYVFDTESDVKGYQNFYKYSGIIKSPFIMRRKGNRLIVLSTQAQMNKGTVIEVGQLFDSKFSSYSKS